MPETMQLFYVLSILGCID